MENVEVMGKFYVNFILNKRCLSAFVSNNNGYGIKTQRVSLWRGCILKIFELSIFSNEESGPVTKAVRNEH